MTRFNSFDEIYSALFVDFDNIYSRLLEQDPTLARTFATNPQRWLRWLEGHALRMIYGDGVRRRVLKRVCYLNPVRYQEFRPYFIRSAFQVVDCPPVTGQGKTSADIQLVIDCMDALAHVTRFDELIILSGDADFTPLLLRIQEHARRSLVLSVGYTSPAYAAACSWRIREDWFLAQALEDPKEDGEGDIKHQDTREDKHPRPQERMEHGKSAVSINLPAFKRIRLVEAIKQLVSESSVPIPLPSVAQVLQREQEATSDWFGAGTLRDLLGALDLAPIAFSPSEQGYVFDPERHARVEGRDKYDDFRSQDPELFDFAQKIYHLTEVPLLSPAQYDAFFSILADEINVNGFSRTGTANNLDDRSEESGLSLGTGNAAFIIAAVIRGGVNLAVVAKSEDKLAPGELKRAFARSVVDLCARSQMKMNDDEMDLLDQWLLWSGDNK